MPLVIPPGYGSAAFVLIGDVGTQPYVTTIGLDLGEAGGDFVLAANSAALAYADAFLGDTSSALTLSHVTLQVGQDGGSGSVQSTNGTFPGTSTGEKAPTAMSVILQKLTANLGRQGRGRMFIPGSVSEGAVNEAGQLNSGSLGAWTGNATAFLENLRQGVEGPAPTVPLEPVLLHSSSALPTPISVMAPAPLVGWVRGRIR